MKQTVLQVEFIRVNGIYLFLENENITAEIKLSKRNEIEVCINNIERFLFANLGNLNHEKFYEIGKVYNELESADNGLHLEIAFVNYSRYELSKCRWNKSL